MHRTVAIVALLYCCVMLGTSCSCAVCPLTQSPAVLSSHIKLSSMVTTVGASQTIEIHSRIKDMEKQGQTVYSLCIGEPDHQPPNEILDATVEAVQLGITKYTPVSGELALREAVARDLRRRKGIPVIADEIVVSNGAKQAVLQALQCVVKPGDKVLIPTPYWTSYPDMIRACGAEPVLLPSKARDGYELRPEVLRAALHEHGDAAKCVILCNPSNPTGCVPSRVAQEALAAVLRDHPGVLVVADEIYERLLFGDAQHTSMASLPGMAARTVTVNGPSKAFAMTGFRIGFSAAPLLLARAMSKVQSQTTGSASSVSQHAALATLTRVPSENPQWLPARLSELQGKRDLAVGLLTAIPSVECATPSGAFYLFPDVSRYYGRCHTDTEGRRVLIDGSRTLCVELLRAEHVALAPGEAFGVDSCVRLCYAAAEDTIREAVGRLAKFLVALEPA